jgi:hypothetical protein
MRRLFQALCAMVALLLLSVHPAGMAEAWAPGAPAAEAALPCHGGAAAVADASPSGHETDKPAGTAAMDCCTDGLCSACTPVAALSGGAEPVFRAFFRAAPLALAGAKLPLAPADRLRRPPRPTT